MQRRRAAIFLTVPPSDVPRTRMALDYATFAARAGYESLIFMVLDGVLLVKKDLFERLELGLRERLLKALEAGVRFAACKIAVEGYGVKELISERVEVWEPSKFFEYASSADFTLSV